MSASKSKASLLQIFTTPRFLFTCFVGCIITLWVPMAEVTATITQEGGETQSHTTQIRMYQIYQQLPSTPESIRLWGYVVAHIGIVVLVSAFVWWLVESAKLRSEPGEE